MAEAGNGQAMYVLGVMNAFGRGVAKDKEQARRWLTQAVKYEVAAARPVLASLEKYRDAEPRDTKPMEAAPRDVKPKDGDARGATPRDVEPRDAKLKDAEPSLQANVQPQRVRHEY
jgi:TPR repeat protein